MYNILFSYISSTEICKPGQFYDVDKETCVECPVGFYQTESSQNFCSACPGDTTTDYSNSKNSSDCKGKPVLWNGAEKLSSLWRV